MEFPFQKNTTDKRMYVAIWGSQDTLIRPNDYPPNDPWQYGECGHLHADIIEAEKCASVRRAGKHADVGVAGVDPGRTTQWATGLTADEARRIIEWHASAGERREAKQ